MLAFGLAIFKYGFVLDLFICRIGIAYSHRGDASITITVGLLWLNALFTIDVRGSQLPEIYQIAQNENKD